MPFIVPEKQKSIPWFAIIATLFIVAVIIVGAYYLFFSPAPAIEVLVPAPLQSANQLSFIEVDPTTVINSKDFRTLRSYTGLLGVGTQGRQNPFLPF